MASSSPCSARPTQPFDLANSLEPDWSIQHPTSAVGKPYAVLSKPIEQSLNDSRSYRMITLHNGLRALLISDEKTDKAAVSMAVGIGHLSDPDDLPGLAHFCEHMLFLGTEKYPQESAYKTFLSANSGSSNASTALAETNYHLDCAPVALPEALSRHAQFFTAPLFDPSCTEREVNAVDSEMARNLQLDARRLFQLGKATSARGPGSVYWKFGTGSKETLWNEPGKRGENVRERLLEWYSKHYSANIMTLAVLGNQTLDELTSLVNTEYSDVPNLNLKPNVFDAPVLTEKELNVEISYRTIKDQPSMRIEWPLPDLRAHWASKPGHFIAHAVGHEGPGSILAELKKLGWATDLSASSSNGSPGFEFFRINVNLTATGLAKYRAVLQLVYAYLAVFNSQPPQRWAWEEMRKLGEIGWRWKENGQPTPLVKGLASRLTEHTYPPDNILVGPWYAPEFDSEAIKRCASDLVKEKSRVFLGSKYPLEGREFWKEKEQYYGTEYEIRPLELVGAEVPASAQLALPEPNIFIPSDLELVTKTPAAEPVKRPSLIRQTSAARLFWKKDDQWLVPRATAYFLLKSPLADATAVAAIKTQLLTSLVEESLAAYSYDATLAGLSYAVGTETDGLQIVLSGYSDKLATLLQVVLNKLKNFDADPQQFEMVHERLTRAYLNTRQNNPYTTAGSHLRHITRQTHWTYDDRLEALEGLTPRDVEEHAQKLFAELQIEALVHGNVTKESALTMLKQVESSLASQPADPSQNDYHRALLLPTPANLAIRSTVPPENINSACSVYYQIGSIADDALVVRLQLFAQLAKVPIFSTLRTKEALGYIVASSSWTSNQQQGFRVIVQSERTAEHLESRMEAFWTETFGPHLESMSDEEFEQQKRGLVQRKREKPKNPAQETSRYWSEIETGELDFFHREREAVLILTLTKADITAFYRTYFNPSSPTRSKLSILMRSQRLQPQALESLSVLLQQRGLSSEALKEVHNVLDGKPTAEEVSSMVNQTFDPVPVAIVDELARLGVAPSLGDVTVIEDIEAFRAGLPRGDGVRPAADFTTDLEAHL